MKHINALLLMVVCALILLPACGGCCNSKKCTSVNKPANTTEEVVLNDAVDTFEPSITVQEDFAELVLEDKLSTTKF